MKKKQKRKCSAFTENPISEPEKRLDQIFSNHKS